MASFGDATSGSIILTTRSGQVPQYFENGPPGVKVGALGIPQTVPCSEWTGCQVGSGVSRMVNDSSRHIYNNAVCPPNVSFSMTSPFNIQVNNPVKETRSMSVPATISTSGSFALPNTSNSSILLSGECSRQRCASEKPAAALNFVTVPFGWRRVISSGKVLYISPSEIQLQSVQEIVIYLQTDGTCKCGLECPLIISKTFDFDPLTPTKSWNVNDFSWNDATKLCNHRRKIIAMATFQNNTGPLPSSNIPVVKKPNLVPLQPDFKRDACLTTTTTATKRKRLKGKSRSPFDGVLVSQLLAQRDKLGLKKDKPNAGPQKPSFEDAMQPNMSQPVHIMPSSYDATVSQTQYPAMESNRSAFKSAMFVPTDEQNVPAFNKANVSSTYCNMPKNPNLCMIEGMSIYGEKRTHGCVPINQQCRPDNTAPAPLLQKHMNPSCVPPNQVMPRTNANYFCNSRPPINNVDQNFRLPLHQNVTGGAPTQFLQPNANMTVNCAGFSPQNINNQLIGAQLPVNPCLDINNYQSTANMIAPNSHAPYPGTFMFRAEIPNQPINNNCANNNAPSASYMNPSYGPTQFTPYPPSPQISSIGFNCPRFPNHNEEVVMNQMPRPKLKKASKAKACKLNCVLDRNSPCPNIDVRQIPSEHHRPSPEAFAAANQNIAPSVITGQPNLQTQSNFLAEQQQFINQTPHLNFQPQQQLQSVQTSSSLQNSGGFITSKTPDSTKLSTSPFRHSPNPVNIKSMKCNTNISVSDPIIHSQNNGNLNSPMLFQNNLVQVNQPVGSVNIHTSLPYIPVSGTVQHLENSVNEMNMSAELNSRNNIMGAMSIGTCTMYNTPSTYVDNLACTMKSTNTVQTLQPIITTSCSQTKGLFPTVNVSSNNFVPLNSQQNTDCDAMFSSQVNPNILNVPFNTNTNNATVQNTSPHIGPICGSQPMINCPSQVRGDISIVQQPLIYNNPALQNNSQNQKGGNIQNFFMQNQGSASIEGMTHSRPPFVQDNSGILVQQVLSQKISDCSPNHIFQSAARAQMMQQVNSMVLPANAATSNNPQQVVLTQTQMRMSNPGGLITMLPSGVPTNSLMPGTQVLTTPTQQLGHQMVLPENMRPNIVSPQPQIMQNNCFIMSQQPTLMARAPTTSPCLSSVPISATYTNSGNCITLSPSQNVCDMDGSKPQQLCEEMPQQMNCEDVQALSQGKEHGCFASFQLLPCSGQNSSGLKPIDILTDGRHTKQQDFKCVMKENLKHMTHTVSSASVKPRPVPSEISPNSILTNNGQFYINSDNNCMQSQSVAVSNMAQFTGMIPIIGNQTSLNTPMPPLSVPNVTAVTTTMTQMIPSIGIAPQILGQPVQPLVQVINTALPFNSMQNAVIVPGGSNVLSQTVRLDTLQTSPVMGAQTSAVFNVLPPNTMNCLPAQSVPNMPSLRCHNPNIPISNLEESKIGIIDHGCDTRSTSGSVSSSSTPASSCCSTPVPVCNEMQNATYRAQSPAVRKRGRDGKRKTNSQTVASMLQNSSHSSPLTITNNSGPAPSSQQQPQPQAQHIASLPQQFLQPPVLQTLTVLPQQPRPILQQPVMNYNSIGSVGGHQILTTGLTSPLGIVQPLGMLGVTPTGAVIQNIPVQQMVPGPHFQSLTVLQSSQPMNPMPQEQSVVVNDTSTIGVHASHLHSAFATGSIVPNVVTANTVISTPVGTTEVLINTSQSSAVEALSQNQTLQQQFSAALGQTIPPVIQSFSPVSCSSATQVVKTSDMTSCSVPVSQPPSNPHYMPTTNLTTCDSSVGSAVANSPVMIKPETPVEVNQNARSIGIQSGCIEQNASVQTLTSSNPVSNSTITDTSSKKSKLGCQQDVSAEHVDTKYEAENSNTLLSSGGESCESPWPDPVNLSAAVRAVVQEQDDSNEDMLTNNLLNSCSKVVSFSECTASLNEEDNSEDHQSSTTPENGEESSNGSSILDLRTGPLPENENPLSKEQDFQAVEYVLQEDSNQPTAWDKEDSPPGASSSDCNVAKNASIASSDTSEQTSTDCNVTSDSGVESSQEPMNLACARGDDIIDTEKGGLSQVDEGDETVFVSFEDAINMDGLDGEIHSQSIKRQKIEMEVLPNDMREDSDEDTPASPPLPPQSRNFSNGDLVWGQIRGFPSWPGKLVREEEVKGTHKTEDGKLWVRWFGDHTFTQVEPDKLKTLSEGLEAHHRARKKHRRGRKMNTQLENAIQEAMTELDRQATSALVNPEPDMESPLPPSSSSGLGGLGAPVMSDSCSDVLRTSSKVRTGRRR